MIVRHAVCEFYGEVAQGAGPVWNGHSPFGADVFETEVEELEKRVDSGKKIPVSADFAKRAVERFDGVGGVDDFSYLGWEVKEGR